MSRPMIPGMAAVLRAAKDNNVAKMTELLALGVDPDVSNQIGQTGLHVAALWGCLEVTDVLLRGDANVNAINDFGVTPLHMAAQKEQVAVIKLLLQWGADTQIIAGNGTKPYEAAKTEEVRALCGAPTLKGHAAVKASDLATLEALLADGSLDLREQDAQGDTVLHLAVKVALDGGLEPPDPSSLQLLLKHAKTARGFSDAHGTIHNVKGHLPLHVAAEWGDVLACEALLAAESAPVNARAVQVDEQHNGQWGKKSADGKLEKLPTAGSTALHLAVSLLQEEAEDAMDDDEEPQLDLDLVTLLLRHGADPNAVDSEGQTPVHIAITGGLHEVVELLIEAKADLSLGCKAYGTNNTALHAATIERDVRMVKLLAANGAKVDAIGRDGWTPLGLAVRSGAVDTAKALLDAGANPHTVSGNGKTPIEIATINKKQKLVEMMQAVGRP